MDPEPTSFSLDMVGAPLFVLARSRVEAANAAMRALLAHGTAAPCALEEMLGGETAAALLATLAADIPKVAPVACRLGPQGQPMILHASRLPGASERWLVTVQADIEARTRDLLARNAELEAILDWLPIGVEIMDDNFRTVMLNRHEEGLLGYTVEETEELEDWWQIAYPDPDYRALVQKSWTEGVALARASDSEMVPQEWQVCCKDGARKTIQFRYRAVGRTHVNVYLDVTRERQLEAMLLDMATTDSLTGLFNRRCFFEKGTACLLAAIGLGQPLSALIIDIDHFKRVNDRYGHAAGDAVLQEIAGRCRAILRKGDVLARIGGEEFAALLPHTPPEEAQAIAERLRREVHTLPVSGAFGAIAVTLSIGGTSTAGDERDLDTVLERADQALYAAKNLGRNQVQFAAPPLPPLDGPLATPPDEAAPDGRDALREVLARQAS